MSGNKDVIDRVLLEERHKQAGTLALSFPWEQGIFKEILGNTAGLPTLPVVEVPLDLPSSSAATLDDFVQVARAAATTEASIANHYRLAVERATWRARSKLSVGEQVTLVCQKFDLILAHDYGRSVVGRTIKELSSTARVDVIADALGGRAVSTLRKRFHQASHYILWCRTNGLEGFPLRFEVISEYTGSLPVSKGALRVTYALEIFRFLQYVLGVDVIPPCLDHPVLRGRTRREALNRPPRKQARPFLASEVLKLEAFLSEYSNSAIDRFGVGCLLFAIFSIARLGDLKAIDGFELDYEEGHDAHGYIETTSFSHKSRMSSNSQGYQMKLIAPIRGIGPGTWGVDFVNAATEVGRPLVKIGRGEPLLPALDVNGDFQLRAMKSSNLVRWVHSVLKGDIFTGHSAKATLLSWLAKWGGSSEERTTLGHHALKDRKSLATYSRDFQAGPLRLLDRMLADVRTKTFLPDCTRSGRFASRVASESADFREPEVSGSQGAGAAIDGNSEAEWYRAAGEAAPGPHEDLGTSDSLERAEPLSSSEWVVPSGDHLDEDRLPLDGEWDEGPSAAAGAGVTDNEGQSSSESSASDSDSSDSSSDSGSSCDANLQLAGEHRASVSPKVEGDCVLYQHSKTRTIHMMPKGSSERKFVCGRSATADHKVFMSIVYTPNMRCKQCLNGRPLRDVGALNEALQSALKRQRSAGK